MAKGPTMKFPEPNAERAMQVANYGMDSMREMTEQSLNQSKALFEGILTDDSQNGRKYRPAST